ncbi:MAG: substrate-binding domain-containing protein [Bacteroidota bacterium]
MKKSVIFITSLFLLIFFSSYARSSTSNQNKAVEKGTINIQCTPDLYNLIQQWAADYQKAYPGGKVNVFNVTGAAAISGMNSGTNMSFVPGELATSLKKETWQIAVGRDAIVPVINPKNPMIEQINTNGVSAAAMATAFSNSEQQDWKSLTQSGKSTPIHFYMVNYSPSKVVVAAFLGLDPSALKGIPLENEKELIAKIQSDPLAIGFCRIADIMDVNTHGIAENISLLPIDKNANGHLDYGEKIYDNWGSFLRGVWIGKFPKALSQNIYCVAVAKPVNESEVSFLTWVLSSGQDLLNQNGFVDLVSSDRQNKIEELSTSAVLTAPAQSQSITKWILISLGALIVLGIIITELARFISRRKSPSVSEIKPSTETMDENSVEVLNGLYFDKTHTWSFMEKNGVVRIGIDDFLQHITGPLTKIKMKNAGEKIQKGEVFLSIIQNGKQLNIKAPISGLIKSQNSLLCDNAKMLNSSPYSEGWVYLIEPENWMKETQVLFMAERYRAWLKNEFSRLKDFLAITINANNINYSPVILQDGGALNDSLLADLGPEVWEDFQINFLDKTK